MFRAGIILKFATMIESQNYLFIQAYFYNKYLETTQYTSGCLHWGVLLIQLSPLLLHLMDC